jgi:putative PIG3 family NAD(P)H quinone oxidoreductase
MASLPNTMTVIAATKPGGPEVLVPETRPVPQLGTEEILVRVRAAGVNRPDVMQRKGLYPPPPGAPDILGLEIAGEIAAIGPGVTRFRVGDQVTALVPGGGYAEFCTVHETNALPVPAGFSLVEAAAIPETYFTVWPNLFRRGRLAAGETALIHGGSSGIGTTAIQLAKAFGAKVIVTAGSAEKCAACLRLGADAAINYNEEDFVAAVKAATGGRGADVILDNMGAKYLGRNVDALATGGRLVVIGLQGGRKAELDLGELLFKRASVHATSLRGRPTAEKAAIVAAVLEHVWPLVADGSVKPVIDSTFPLADAAAAHRLVEGSTHIGKVLLTL